MSHFTTLKTQFVSKEHLRSALVDAQEQFGLGVIQENTMVSGYEGDQTRAELVVTTRDRDFDIGFSRAGDSYEMVADWWGIRAFRQDDLLKKLQQRYAYHAVRAQLDAGRFSVVEETLGQDETVRIVVRRVV